MSLMPKKVKYRKVQRGRMTGRSKGARTVYFGEYGLQALEPAFVTAAQIEAMRVALARRLKGKKVGNFFVRVFPDKPYTKKPAETRMGKGKGNVEHWVAVVKRERVICEVGGMDMQEAREILKHVAYKLPLRTRFVTKASEAAQTEGNLP
jgi:large subunit ribosomal protein L16